MTTFTRRNFLKYSMAAGTTALICGTASTPRVFGANDRLRIAVAVVRPEDGAPVGEALGDWHAECRRVVDQDREVLGADEAGNAAKGEGDHRDIPVPSPAKNAGHRAGRADADRVL